jgi:hypothetical protein
MVVGAAFRQSGSDRVLDRLRSNGASFVHDLASACSMSAGEVRAALAELVAAGHISCDGPAGLRRIIGSSAAQGVGHSEGRWFALSQSTTPRAAAVETLAWTLPTATAYRCRRWKAICCGRLRSSSRLSLPRLPPRPPAGACRC